MSKNPGNVALRKKKKQSKADLNREWNIPPYYKLRYNGMKGVVWYWFARYVRMRDYKEWGTCISCGKKVSFEDLDAGHFMPAGSCGLDLLFDERNVNGECGGCNGFDDSHLLWYAENLDKRFGKGTAEQIKKRYRERHQSTTKHDDTLYRVMALQYMTRFMALDTQ